MRKITASALHEQRLLERLDLAAAELHRTEEEATRARLARDAAVRAAAHAGIPRSQLSETAGLSASMVPRILAAPR